MPMLPPPSSRTVPSFDLRESKLSSPAANLSSGSHQAPALMSHKFMPQTSLMSNGAILPKNIEARKDDTSVIRVVLQ